MHGERVKFKTNMLKINQVKNTVKVKTVLKSTDIINETHLNLEQKYITFSC